MANKTKIIIIKAVSLVHAFVFSRLDYCSSIFAILPGVRMETLKRVLRIAYSRIPPLSALHKYSYTYSHRLWQALMHDVKSFDLCMTSSPYLDYNYKQQHRF